MAMKKAYSPGFKPSSKVLMPTCLVAVAIISACRELEDAAVAPTVTLENVIYLVSFSSCPGFLGYMVSVLPTQ